MRVSYLYMYQLLKHYLVFDSHIEHYLEMIKTRKYNGSLKKYLKELYSHQNTTDTDVDTDNCKRA